LITGASTGIGAASALELARRGLHVFAGVRNACDGTRLSAQSNRITPVLIDVTDGGQITAAVESLGRALGDAGLSGLVNNAGIVVAGPLEFMPLDRLRRQFEVNLFGQIAVTQAFLPMLRKARGRIVNISSVNGRIAAPYIAPYSASKHAFEAMNNALRVELRAWGIRVILIAPGATTTPIWEKSISAADALGRELGIRGTGPYERDLEAMRQSILKAAASALPVESVVRCVTHALTARRPYARYSVGLKVNLLLRAHKWIPDRLWDWIVQRSLRLPKT
jgi:NAD(P)-dependent dehydrogenase (short-subunit alcohol dehydrogenase family)